MRKTTLVTLITVFSLTISNLNAQTLDESLKKSVAKFDSAKTENEMIAVASQLDMLTAKYAGEWQSLAYAAYAKITTSFKLTDKVKRDAYIDVANSFLEKADKLSANNQELLILHAWATKARIAVDGKDRWKKYDEEYTGYIEKARKMNAENPRIIMLDGMGPFYKPKMWGGGKEKAKPYFEKAKPLYAKEDKSTMLKFHWGEAANEDYLKQCNE